MLSGSSYKAYQRGMAWRLKSEANLLLACHMKFEKSRRMMIACVGSASGPVLEASSH